MSATVAKLEYPVSYGGEDDPRWDKLARDVGRVFEEHAFPRMTNADRMNLADVLFKFIYVGEKVPRRPRATPASFTAGGELTSDDCSAHAFALRELKDATGVLVIAASEGEYFMGSALDAGSAFERVHDHLIAELERKLAPHTASIRDHVYDTGGGAS